MMVYVVVRMCTTSIEMIIIVCAMYCEADWNWNLYCVSGGKLRVCLPCYLLYWCVWVEKERLFSMVWWNAQRCWCRDADHGDVKRRAVCLYLEWCCEHWYMYLYWVWWCVHWYLVWWCEHWYLVWWCEHWYAPVCSMVTWWKRNFGTYLLS
jgi:hypothetical protein